MKKKNYLKQSPEHSFRNRMLTLGLVIVLAPYCLSVAAKEKSETSVATSQQAIKVSGTVSDASGSLPGVNVVVKGSKAGTITDINGKYTIVVPNEKATLTYSYIGFKTISLPVNGKTLLNVTMTEDTKKMDEVVVVGYGTQKKVNLTGAVATVGAETFASKGTVTSPLASLQGEVAGVTVTRSSSSPTRSGWDINIRGLTSVNDSKPLVIVDGIPGGIDEINPDDIESISILKDASAAIYGARSAAGVVLVTTKRGKEHKTQVTYKGNLTAHTPGLIMNYMNMKHYMTTFEEAYVNDNPSLISGNLNIYPRWVVNAYKMQKIGNTTDLNSPYYTGPFQGMNTWAPYTLNDIHDYGFYDVDWNKMLWGTAYSQSHTVSVSGGSAINTYNLSAGYTQDNSVLQWGDDNLKRFTLRLNNDTKISDRVKLSSNISFDRTLKLYPQRKPNDVGGQPAGSPIATENGLPYGWGGQFGSHWFSKLGGDVNEASNNFTANFTLTANLLKGLDWVSTASARTSNYYNKWWENKIQWYYLDESKNLMSPTSDKVGLKNENSVYQNYTSYLEFKKTINRNDFAAMGGASFETNERRRNELVSLGNLTDIIKTTVGGTTYSYTEIAEAWGLASYFGRLNYGYAGKYLAEVLGRYDGSSSFLKGYRWHGYYGASLGYRVSEEKFMKDLGVFDNLKLRASYGTTGNQSGIEVYDGVTFLNFNNPAGTTPTQPLFGEDGSVSMLSTLTERRIKSPERTWETITSSNVGLDFTILQNRLNGTLEYYWKRNDNMLVQLTYPVVLGQAAPKTNYGTFKSNGWELSLNWRDKIGELNYSVGFNVSDNKSVLISLKNATTPGLGYNNKIEGQPIGTFWGHKALGLITTQEALDAYKQIVSDGFIKKESLRIGDMMYADTDNDGSVTTNDLVKLGEDSPRLSFGVNLNLNWKGIDLAAFFQGVGKRTVMRDDYTRGPMLSWYQRQNDAWYGKWYSDIAASDYVVTNNLQEYYTPVQTGADLLPKLTADDAKNKYNYTPSSAWYSTLDGKYVRLKNITFGYTLPKKLVSKANMEKVRLYFTGTDLWEISKIKDGWDPETKRDAFGGTIGANAYPFTRGFTFGLDVTF